MKKLIVLIIAILLFSCSKKEEEIINENYIHYVAEFTSKNFRSKEVDKNENIVNIYEKNLTQNLHNWSYYEYKEIMLIGLISLNNMPDNIIQSQSRLFLKIGVNGDISQVCTVILQTEYEIQYFDVLKVDFYSNY